MRLLFRGARVISPADNYDSVMDLLVENGCIVGVGHDLASADGKIVNARGLVLLPGLVDLHAHLGEPGNEERETLETGALAAAHGGYTTILAMPNTDPIIDTPLAVAQMVALGKQAPVHILVAGALTRGLKGEEMAELAAMASAGASALVQPEGSVPAAGLLRRIMQYAHGLVPLIAEQPCDSSLAADGLMHEGLYSTVYGMKGIPTIAEEVAVARDVLLAEETGCPLHLSHISTAGSVRLIAAAKAKGVPVTCSVSPYHLTLTDEALSGYDPNCKLLPPLRSATDVAALRVALADGTIDCVITDHTPLTAVEKDVEFHLAPWGATALETTLPLLYTDLVKSGHLTWTQLVNALAVRPAQLLGISDTAGTLQPGAPADFVLINPNQAQAVDEAKLLSLSRNNPIVGRELYGWPKFTYVNGKQIWSEEQ